MTSRTKPILVCMSWRGGERLARCLRSIAAAMDYFDRIVISVTAADDSDDMRQVREFRDKYPQVEVLCTGQELPTMQHQSFWVDYLERTGARPTDWVYWLAYDDEVRPGGIQKILDTNGSWQLRPGTAYFGPWAMRHEQADRPFDGPRDVPLESWTSFPQAGPTRLPVITWIADQFAQPTYMQMSGSVNQFACFTALRDAKPAKQGPMRIEMAIASAPPNRFVEEFAEPVSIIYGRPNSDRASYGKAARTEDLHLLRWLGQYLRRNPQDTSQALTGTVRTSASYIRTAATKRALPAEEWRVRGTVEP